MVCRFHSCHNQPFSFCKLDKKQNPRTKKQLLTNKVLKQYLARIKDILAELPIKIEFRHVLRGKNKEADALLNKTLNAVCKD